MSRSAVVAILYLSSFVSCEPHTPKVREDNRNVHTKARNIRGSDSRYAPPVFDFQSAPQQDLQRARYFQQQLSDMANLKTKLEKKKRSKPQYLDNDLDGSDSEIVEQKVTKKSRYIYVQPSILKNNFGLDSETADEILKKSTPGNQISALEDLIGKNPHVQLEGLQRLLKESDVVSAEGRANLDGIQKQLEAATSIQTEAAFEQAQRQAQAHVEAQNKAIALAQKQIEEAALARIEAHNSGRSVLDLNEIARIQEEAIAQLKPLGLQGHPQAVGDAKNALAQSYYTVKMSGGSNDPHRVSHAPQTPEEGPSSYLEVETFPQLSKPYSASLPQFGRGDSAVGGTGQHYPISLKDDGDDGSYHDLHQYAAKYAFGYQILDGEHGNDFGHEEKRNGKSTKGQYFVVLPDGRKQRVDYYVDEGGYHARVSYENIGKHDVRHRA
ncbi:uncharacterized protein LOC132698337 [Cylas formicarius]|uniref:uncharacterized protein LOC132698337 n=1 Tax=Cylas formicarius TaxID=197179 RepID=UPI002958B673|nr:uncharacterized protein LOC132698337 [Cylas formicarius]